ncbi:hypothetical protein Esi_0538_0001 [Ectocarpus siliculosus]|uniref:Zinc finger RING-type eukaryotic domain-containing protein n=1 Tax=Ectocarpus siliculosus TaxID=2880 RepID=D8LPV3_ECTSI|nr:hypothetical protein Esi_0538_0001 [Ectocarpus siliculosus]|eukprot:CBN79874.1 hypothetical protein Esi_0538_0001 [Ectocarpus siliculosus]
MHTTTTIDPTAASAWDVEALEGGDESGRDTDAPSNASISSGRGGREVHSVCPICLGKFEEPVTLTSCLHTFCHTWLGRGRTPTEVQNIRARGRIERGLPVGKAWHRRRSRAWG